MSQQPYEATMNDVIAALKRTDAEERIRILKLEIDYELATLYDAIKDGDYWQRHESKLTLRELWLEMIRLEM